MPILCTQYSRRILHNDRKNKCHTYINCSCRLMLLIKVAVKTWADINFESNKFCRNQSEIIGFVTTTGSKCYQNIHTQCILAKKISTAHLTSNHYISLIKLHPFLPLTCTHAHTCKDSYKWEAGTHMRSYKRHHPLNSVTQAFSRRSDTMH